jgi:nucleoside-diphosphate-sugar epimerase
MAKFTLERGFAPIVGTGKAEWDNVHVHDLSAFLVTLVEASLDTEKNKDAELFGRGAYYFLEHGVQVWGDVAEWIAEEAYNQGYLKEPTVKGAEELKASSLGTNSKSVAARARKYFGWKPTGRSLRDEVPAIVASEARLLGLKRSQ